MEMLSERAVRITNRVSLSMVFAEASGHREQAQKVVDEAFSSSLSLLDEIDAAELRSWFEGFASVFGTIQSALISDSELRARFVATNCDLLSEMGLHQKTIETVGDELAKWQCERVSMDEFGAALDGLVSLMTDHAGLLSNAIEKQAGNDSEYKRRAIVFSHAVCGLVIVLGAINQAIKQKDPHSGACSAIASFGAGLTVQSVNRLFEVCNLIHV